MAANEQHLFGTGYLRIGSVGGTLTNVANGIGVIQSAELDVSYQEKKLMDTPQKSMFAVDVAFYGGICKFKFETNGFERDLLVRILGGALTSNAGVDTITIGKTSKPAFVRLEFDGLDNAGKSVNIVLPRAYSLSLPVSLKLDDFGSMSVEFEGLPDTTTGTVATIAAAQ
jgi:hypothetical protein